MRHDNVGASLSRYLIRTSWLKYNNQHGAVPAPYTYIYMVDPLLLHHKVLAPPDSLEAHEFKNHDINNRISTTTEQIYG